MPSRSLQGPRRTPSLHFGTQLENSIAGGSPKGEQAPVSGRLHATTSVLQINASRNRRARRLLTIAGGDGWGRIDRRREIRQALQAGARIGIDRRQLNLLRIDVARLDSVIRVGLSLCLLG